MGVKVIDAPPSMAELRRRPADELHGLIEDMIKVLEAKVQPDLRRGRYPDKRAAQKVAQLVHAVARELEV
jgi:CspA family cold shock protein